LCVHIFVSKILSFGPYQELESRQRIRWN